MNRTRVTSVTVARGTSPPLIFFALPICYTAVPQALQVSVSYHLRCWSKQPAKPCQHWKNRVL